MVDTIILGRAGFKPVMRQSKLFRERWGGQSPCPPRTLAKESKSRHHCAAGRGLPGLPPIADTLCKSNLGDSSATTASRSQSLCSKADYWPGFFSVSPGLLPGLVVGLLGAPRPGVVPPAGAPRPGVVPPGDVERPGTSERPGASERPGVSLPRPCVWPRVSSERPTEAGARRTSG